MQFMTEVVVFKAFSVVNKENGMYLIRLCHE